MRVLVQRCKHAAVTVGGETVGQIGSGLLLLVGFTHDDTEREVRQLAERVTGLRIFEDEAGKMNASVREIGGELLSVSQFTLYGDCRKGRRPNFMQAARPEQAAALYELFNAQLALSGLQVETGRFGAMMDVELTNWGPVTLMLESPPSRD
ncbi:D-tyrosyl-tRNA(Tyr) deacylase [Paenibacillus sp. IB182496]|uniref:D-aminoacyl-tRNA deacylase n=1 Tax=Paenibacillus sabuli TaxID=2772509 RepID=A0A927BS88_9BACL|nr:D-aminoacyl-tRNA deacylase [Paenibacillus sabuli]MBD2844569.1 D-tyrosyl-tRNA(Tyr) deacylase [Paenibacillus sabuli]